MDSAVETVRDTVGSTKTLPSLISDLNIKLHTGIYKTEKVSCFCGSDKCEPIVKKDRYGLPYTAVLCHNCGIIYSQNRLTKGSNALFYLTDYRNLYDFGLDIEKEHNALVEKGKEIYKMVQGYYLDPIKTVYDIGCNSGGVLDAFKNSDCYGVDFDMMKIAYGQFKGLNIKHGGMESLEQGKADVVILNHVLEHFNDLDIELDNIRKLLKPNGIVYVEVPGLYAWNQNTLWQLAHNYQFISHTLQYVMNACGWEELYCDDYIKSVWRYTGKRTEKVAMPVVVRELINYLNGEDKLPTIKTSCRFTLRERMDSLKESLSKGLGQLGEIANKEIGSSAVIVTAGPTIEGHVDKIRDMQSNGKKVIAIDRMQSWCLTNGITPDYVIGVDSCMDTIENYNTIHDDTTFILSGHVRHEILDKLKGKKVFLFVTSQPGMDTISDLWEKNGYEKMMVVNAGGSVSLTAMSIAMTLGMKDIHLFGFDCHTTKKKYADGITGQGENLQEFQVKVGDRVFTTLACYMSFAQQFFELKKLGEAHGLLDNVKIYGDSLVSAMSVADIKGD